MEESKGKQQQYRVWTPTQRVEIGKHATEHDNAPTVRAMALYDRQWRQVDLLETEKSKESTDSDIKEILREKTCRPTLLPKKLMKKVI